MRTPVAHPPARPLLIFDGDCNFCRRWISRWQQTTGDLVDYVPFQDARVAEQFPELSRERFEQAVHLIEPDGQVYAGAEAAARALACRQRWPLWIYQEVPGAASICDHAYRLVAKNRAFFSLLTRLLWGEHIERPTHLLVRRIFLGLLGVVYFIAFVSFWSQIDGLVGSHGIQPVQQAMPYYSQRLAGLGAERFLRLPTLCWFSTGDHFLHFQCAAGTILAVLLIVGLAPWPCLVLLWGLYLSLVTIGGVFMSYQWDALLLETGLLTIFFASPRPWPNLRREAEPSRLALWLLRWLLFRLMFGSGCVKLLSGDATWLNCTALNYHYQTQPLPTPVAWYAHQLPAWFQKGSVVVMFGIELIVPFFIFLPRRIRFLAFWLFVFLQLIITLTGNYTFFNLLAIALCVLLLDDFALLQLIPARWRERIRESIHVARPPPLPVFRRLRLAVVTLVAAVVLPLTTMIMVSMFWGRQEWPQPMMTLYRWTAPLRSLNRYGLFAVMTTTRPEIIVEGSNDGQTWLPYEFKDKPGDSKRRPRFVAPHQPRLDWQMWFAALNPTEREPWFMNFAFRLLQGSPEVLALLESNPFPEAPPKFLRASLYEYSFTNRAERRKNGTWWRRDFKGYYCPPVSLPANQQDR